LEVSIGTLGFGLLVVGAGVVIGNTVLVGEGLRGEFLRSVFSWVRWGIRGGFVGRSGNICWWGRVIGTGHGHGEHSGKDSTLKIKKKPKIKPYELFLLFILFLSCDFECFFF
jgi:hypothetical protein